MDFTTALDSVTSTLTAMAGQMTGKVSLISLAGVGVGAVVFVILLLWRNFKKAAK